MQNRKAGMLWDLNFLNFHLAVGPVRFVKYLSLKVDAGVCSLTQRIPSQGAFALSMRFLTIQIFSFSASKKEKIPTASVCL
jgi:hypothetical protein